MAAIQIYRVSNWLYRYKVPVLPFLLKSLNRILFAVVIPPSASIGRNVLFSYEGLGTVIHRRAVLNDDCVIGAGVTIGGRSGSENVPVIGKGAMIGTGAKILGDVNIGEYVSIGANAVVLNDIPPYGVAVGIPAKVIKVNRPENLPNYRSFKK